MSRLPQFYNSNSLPHHPLHRLRSNNVSTIFFLVKTLQSSSDSYLFYRQQDCASVCTQIKHDNNNKKSSNQPSHKIAYYIRIFFCTQLITPTSNDYLKVCQITYLCLHLSPRSLGYEMSLIKFAPLLNTRIRNFRNSFLSFRV